MKRCLMIFTIALILVTLIGSSAFATGARVLSLGNKDYFFKDIVHVFDNPAYLGMYTNYVYAEFGAYDWFDTPDNQILGVHYNLKNGFSLGLTLNRQVDFLEDFLYEIGYDGYIWPMNEYDILAAYDFAENLHFGIGFYHAGDKDEYSNTETDTTVAGSVYTYDEEYSGGINMFSGGFIYDFENGHSFEGWFKLRFDRFNFMENETEYNGNWWEWTAEIDGGTGMEFGARGFFNVFGEDFQVIPLFMFRTEKASADFTYSEDYGTPYDTAYSTAGDFKRTDLLFGLGGNLTLDKGMIAGGFHFRQSKEENDISYYDYFETKDTFIPGFNLAVEYWLTDWLISRFGMEKQFRHMEWTEEEKTSRYPDIWVYKWRSSSDPDDFVTVGVGFKFSKFRVDATIREETLFEGTDLLSGTERNLFGNLSVLFEF